MADSKPMIKQLIDLEVKDAEKGEVEAVVATFDVVDGDGDVVRPDAIPEGSSVKVSSYGHDVVLDRRAPVGKGTVTRRGSQAIFKGRMFLTTERGRETFDVLREMGSDQEWSFGYRVLGAEVPDEELQEKGALRILTKLDAFEVSPVLRGAGVDTYTVAVKSAVVPENPTEEEDATEPEGTESKAMPEPGDGESHDDFISRCHSAMADEFEDEDQRNAVCEERWQAQKDAKPDDSEETKEEDPEPVEEEEVEAKAEEEPAEPDDPFDDVLERIRANNEYADAIAAKRQAERDLEVATKRLEEIEAKRRADREEQKAIEAEFTKFEKTRKRLGAQV